MPLLMDTGFLYATIDGNDTRHKQVLEILPALHGETWLVPTTVLVEVTYLLGKRLGHEKMRQFIATIQQGPFEFISITKSDLPRIHQLLTTYSDAKLDFVDASITTLAERLNIRTILTVDRRDFGMIRPKHCDYFNILP